MPVLYDADGRLQALLRMPSNEVHLVLAEGAVVHFERHYGSGAVEDEVVAALEG